MNHRLLYQLISMIAQWLPCLNSWQQENVGLFAYGVIRGKSCQQLTIARQVCCGEQVDSTMRRWRRFLNNARFPLEAFFVEWTRWVLSGLPERRLTLLVDETKLHDRVGVMMIGVAWEGRCLPLIWRVYTANSAAEYPPEGQVGMIAAMLRTLQAGIPAGTEVLLLADRGIGTSPQLCREVAALGWHYLFRITCQTKLITPEGDDLTIAAQVQPGEIWQGSGEVFKQRGRIPAHARALWEEGCEEPWALVTNDPRLTGHEYARRNWQEQSFRDLKSGGWHWGQSRIRRPDHAARLLVMLVIAYVWMVALGSQTVDEGRGHALTRNKDGTLRRAWSLFKEGVCEFTVYVERKTVCRGLVFIPDKRFT